MGKKKRTNHSATQSAPPPNNPFGALAELRDELPEGDTRVHAGESAPEPETASGSLGRAIVRRERKGHGGKTVTVIERVVLHDDDLRALKRDLGLGARREEADTVIVQGDVVERVRRWLAGR